MNKIIKLMPVLVVLGLGCLGIFAFAPFNKPLIMLVSLLGLLWFYENNKALLSKKQIFAYGYVYGLGFFLANLCWVSVSLYRYMSAPVLVASLAHFFFAAYLALWPAIALLAFHQLRNKSDEFSYLFLFPSLWVLAEWFRGWLFTGFSWYDMGYTQLNNYLMHGVYPVLGSYGVSWIFMSVVGFLFVVLQNRHTMTSNQPKITRANRYAVIYFVLLAITGYYLHDKEYTTSYGRPATYALIQGNISANEKWATSLADTLNIYSSMIAKAKADIILIPETAISMFEEDLPEHYVDDITTLARNNNAQLVIGIPQKMDEQGDYGSAAVVFTESGHPYYAKSHLVPFGEYIPLKWLFGPVYNFANIPAVGFSSGGTHQMPLLIAGQKVAFNICYENAFNSELIASARQSTVMVNITDMVWFGDTIAKDHQLQMSQARAIENGRYFIQETNSGITAIIDRQGHITAKLPEFSRDTLIDSVQGYVGETLYQKFGNYLIILWCSLLVGIGLIVRFRKL